MEPFYVFIVVFLLVVLVWALIRIFQDEDGTYTSTSSRTYYRPTYYPSNINDRYYVSTNNRVYHEPEYNDSSVLDHLDTIVSNMHFENESDNVGSGTETHFEEHHAADFEEHNVAADLGADIVSGILEGFGGGGDDTNDSGGGGDNND